MSESPVDELTRTAQEMGMYGDPLRREIEELACAFELILNDIGWQQPDGSFTVGEACNQFVANIATTALRHAKEALGRGPATFVPPMWFCNGAKIGRLDVFDGTVYEPERAWRVERLRLRETAEDSTCMLDDIEAGDAIPWADKDRPNVDKRMHVTVAYVLDRFGPIPKPAV